MTGVQWHPQEEDRLEAVRSYGLLDSDVDPHFAALAELAARACGTPMAAVSLLDEDRQWFVATHGLGTTREIPRGSGMCSAVVAAERPLTITDLRRDPRWANTPLVRADLLVRGYAGVPLVSREGLPLGAVCVLDTAPHQFTGADLATLHTVASQAALLMEQARTEARRSRLGTGASRGAAVAPRHLRRALDAGEFEPSYQPIVDLDTGRLRSYEALLRWNHPTAGVLAPATFLTALEASEVIVPVGRTVLDHALTTLTALRPHGGPDRVAVNVCAAQLSRPGYARDVDAALCRHDLDGNALTVELTESSPLVDPEVARWELLALREIGVDVAFDDFGAGWSNLSRLLELPFTSMKIDRSLVTASMSDIRATRLLEGALRLASGLSLDVVAEGVETNEVADHLRDRHCRWAQGWLYGRPQPRRTLLDRALKLAV